MVRFRSVIAAFLLLAGSTASSHLLAQSAAPRGKVPDRAALVAAVDSLARAEIAAGRSAGLSIAVARGGELLMAKGYGYADLENEVPASERTVFRIGSITKQFTAAAILKLAEEGKLSLDDELTKFLPDYPTGGRRITVHHLLTHTSGIKSYTGLGPKWTSKMRLDLTHDELLALFKDEPFDFEPGAKHLYNNSGYYLLGMIVEKVTGRPYGEYLAETFFRPLGLEATRYCDERPLVKHRARGYALKPGGLVNAEPLSMTQPFAAGSLCSSVPDLVRWQQALAGGKVVSAASYRRMTTPATLNDGSATSYGYGLALGSFEGRAQVAHGGGINGFITQLSTLPTEGLTVVVLSNTEAPVAPQLTEKIMRRALGIAEPALKALPLAPAERARYEGTYDLGPLQLRVSSEGERLMAQGTNQAAIALLYQGEHTFVAEADPNIRLVFQLQGERATGLTLHQSGAVIPARRIP